MIQGGENLQDTAVQWVPMQQWGAEAATIVSGVVYAAGAVLLAVWLARTYFGTRALEASRPRHNRLPVYLPFVALGFYFVVISLAAGSVKQFGGNLAEWEQALLQNGAGVFAGVLLVVVLARIVRVDFEDGLRGFGLRAGGIFRDIGGAIINLLTVQPVLVSVAVLTVVVGKYLVGPDFELPKHEAIETVGEHRRWQVILCTVVYASVVAPVFEEFIFRGLFQSLLRRVTESPWLSVFIASGMFTVVHPNASHWGVLFVLAVCLGYSYEKSGSLWRPIFIHAIFNTTALVTLFSQWAAVGIWVKL